MAVKTDTDIIETVVNEEIKDTSLQILQVEKDAIIVKLDGWRRRVYFEDGFDASELRKNTSIKVQYKGDIIDPFKVELLKLK